MASPLPLSYISLKKKVDVLSSSLLSEDIISINENYDSSVINQDKYPSSTTPTRKRKIDPRTLKYITSNGKDNKNNDNKNNDNKKKISSLSKVTKLNSLRREAYSKMELIRMDIEDYIENLKVTPDSIIMNMIKGGSSSKDEIDKCLELIKEIEHICKALKLQAMPLRWGGGLFAHLETAYRGLTLMTIFIIIGIFGSMSLLFLKFVDSLRGKGEGRISDKVRSIIAYSVLKVLGIKVEVRGDTYNQSNCKEPIFAEPGCHLLTFSHASNLDGFIVSAAVPINHIAIAKKELFLIPFFSWISLAFGGLPVDRENRDRAIAALKKATDAAASDEGGLKTAIVIAPEGTRSTSGQLLDLKKGTFHIWDQMRCPIVPLVTIGAFDLYPPGSMVNRTGKVYTTFLPPILPSDASNRDDMLRLVRRKILEHLAQPSPDDLCSDISISEKLSSWLLGLSTILFDYAMFKAAHFVLLTHYGLSIFMVVIGSVLTSILITVLLYIYFVYIASASSSSSSTKKTAEYSETWRDSSNTNKDD